MQRHREGGFYATVYQLTVQLAGRILYRGTRQPVVRVFDRQVRYMSEWRLR